MKFPLRLLFHYIVAFYYLRGSLYFRIVKHHFFFEDISACLGRFLHFDDFAVGASFTLLKRDALTVFFAMGQLVYLISFVNGHSFEDGVVFLLTPDVL